LVETVKAYMKHEREALEAVIRARNSAASAAGRAAANPADARAMQELIGAESALGQSLGRLVALAEAYPDLKANQNMGQLMEELASTENRVSFARQAYNDAVMHYNNAREGFPINLFAAGLGFQPATSYEIANPAEKEPVRVSFSA
ncbi:MAG: LemA family protein, partial [Bacteriovoracia bacterium]